MNAPGTKDRQSPEVPAGKPDDFQHILIVDDEESIRFTLTKYLKDAGYLPHPVSTPEEAHQMMDSEKFAVAIVDRLLANGQSGLDLMRHLRSRQPDCQPVLISGYPSFESAAEAIGMKVFAYLAKPVRKYQILSVVKEAAEQYQALRLAAVREELFAHLFDSSSEAVSICDAAGNALFINPAFTRLFGYERGEARGRRVPAVPEAHREQAEEEWRRFQAHGEPEQYQVVRLARDGRRLVVWLSLVPIAGGGPSPRYTMAVYRQVTAIDAAGNQEPADGSGPSSGAFFRHLAHDFNNVITVILGNSQLCEMYLKDNAKAGACLKNIMDAGQRARELSEQLTRGTH